MPYDFKQLKAGRERLGLTQTELADILGLTKQALSYIEHGLRQSPPTIKAYADAVRVRMKDIVISDEEFEALRVADDDSRELAGARR